MKTVIPLARVSKLLKANDVEFAGIFGSYAKEMATEESDIDILVRFSKPTSLISIVHLENELGKILKKEVDLVTVNALSPYIKDEVFESLVIIYGKK